MILKASTVSNLTDARYFAALGVDFLGFSLDETNPNYINPETLNAIRGWVEGPAIVGEFETTSLEVVKASAEFYLLDVVQVNLFDFYKNIDVLKGLKVIGKLQMEQLASFEDVNEIFQKTKDLVEYFLIDLGAASAAEHTRLVELSAHYPILLHSTAKAEDLVTDWHNTKPTGFSFSGGEEEKIGIKTFDDLEAYFDALEPFR